MARRKNTKRIDPRYFMDEKTDIIKEEMKDYYGGEAHSQSKADAAMPRRYGDEVIPYEPYYRDDVKVDSAKLAADMKNALKNFSTEQIVDQLEQGLQFLDKPGREAFIAIAEIFDDLGKPHHGKHPQDLPPRA
jgi:hypothetical protein